jgi:hypothetical protein
VTAFVNEQCRLTYHGRSFHFVSYEGQRANERKNQEEMPAMWYLMGPGRRWPVMPCIAGQPVIEVRRDLLAWLETQGLDQPPPPPA